MKQKQKCQKKEFILGENRTRKGSKISEKTPDQSAPFKTFKLLNLLNF